MTFVVLILSYAFIRQRKEIRLVNAVFRAYRAQSVCVNGDVGVLDLDKLLLVSGNAKGQFIDGIFEVVSAFGTVGLSRGITADLNVFGQMLLMFLMFLDALGINAGLSAGTTQT